MICLLNLMQYAKYPNLFERPPSRVFPLILRVAMKLSMHLSALLLLAFVVWISIVACGPPIVYPQYSATITYTIAGEQPSTFVASVVQDLTQNATHIINETSPYKLNNLFLLKDNTGFRYIPSEGLCNVECWQGYCNCWNSSGCRCFINPTFLQPLTFLPNASPANKTCALDGSLWELLFEENIYAYYCISKEDVPVFVEYVSADDPLLLIEYKNFVPKIEDPSIFDIPPFCPCFSGKQDGFSPHSRNFAEFVKDELNTNHFKVNHK